VRPERWRCGRACATAVSARCWRDRRGVGRDTARC
jgi:hypothetical protein